MFNLGQRWSKSSEGEKIGSMILLPGAMNVKGRQSAQRPIFGETSSNTPEPMMSATRPSNLKVLLSVCDVFWEQVFKANWQRNSLGNSIMLSLVL